AHSAMRLEILVALIAIHATKVALADHIDEHRLILVGEGAREVVVLAILGDGISHTSDLSLTRVVAHSAYDHGAVRRASCRRRPRPGQITDASLSNSSLHAERNTLQRRPGIFTSCYPFGADRASGQRFVPVHIVSPWRRQAASLAVIELLQPVAHARQ